MELELINSLKEIAGENSLGLTDDCAVFGEYCITKDLLSENVHFFKDDAPFNLARKILRVNLSDLAAMGAEPFGVMIGACLNKSTSSEWLAEFNRGIKADIDEFGFQLLGGDTVFHDAPSVFSVTAIGKTDKPILRSGAQIGDNIFVSGNIGDAYLGLLQKKQGLSEGNFIEKYELPTPRIDLSLKLRGIANSCMDISDGLLLDLSRLCEASGVGAEIFAEQIPTNIDVIPNLFRNLPDEILKQVQDDKIGILDLISGGDDYELLFTSAHEEVEGCFKIGKIIAGSGLKLDGEKIEAKGYIHN